MLRILQFRFSQFSFFFLRAQKDLTSALIFSLSLHRPFRPSSFNFPTSLNSRSTSRQQVARFWAHQPHPRAVHSKPPESRTIAEAHTRFPTGSAVALEFQNSFERARAKRRMWLNNYGTATRVPPGAAAVVARIFAAGRKRNREKEKKSPPDQSGRRHVRLW